MSMDFAITDRRHDDSTHVVAVTGEIDLFTAPEFKQRVSAPIDAGSRQVQRYSWRECAMRTLQVLLTIR